MGTIYIFYITMFKCGWLGIVPPVHLGAVLLENKLIGCADDCTLMAVVPPSQALK